MSDPLQPVQPGQISPMTNSVATVNGVLESARAYRGGRMGRTGGESGTAGISPTITVRIRNNSITNMDVGSVLAIGDPVFDLTDDDQRTAFIGDPTFEGDVPAAITDAFVILLEPIAGYLNGKYSYGRGVIAGVVPCMINVTDAGHGYATPTAADETKLTSATTGAARILWKDSGTGTKQAEVSLEGTAAGTPGSLTFTTVDGSPSYSSITTVKVDEADGFVLSQPGAGIARIDINAADETHYGVMTNIAQRLAGVKRFADDVEGLSRIVVGIDDAPLNSEAGLIAAGVDTIIYPDTATTAPAAASVTMPDGSTQSFVAWSYDLTDSLGSIFVDGGPPNGISGNDLWAIPGPQLSGGLLKSGRFVSAGRYAYYLPSDGKVYTGKTEDVTVVVGPLITDTAVLHFYGGIYTGKT